MRVQAEVRFSRNNKGCFIFLLDQSYSMIESLGGSIDDKQGQLSLAVNSWLSAMIARLSKADGVQDWFDIGIFGYRTDDQGETIIESAFHGPLLGSDVSTITDIADNPREMQARTQLIPDEETGETLEITVENPVWVVPVAEGGTPMCHALLKAHEVVSGWINDHQQSFPPIVIHFTDGESQDGDPIPYAESLMGLATDHGHVLLFNVHLSATAAETSSVPEGSGLWTPGNLWRMSDRNFVFPASDEVLPDEYSRILFEMSSELPEWFVNTAIELGMGAAVPEGARGMAYNSDMTALMGFLYLLSAVVID